jgi:hypothetical protein
MKWMWIVGSSILAVIVAMIATTTIPASTIAPDEATLRMFPQATQGVAFIDFAALRNTPLFQEAIAEKSFQLPNGLKDFAEATGFALDKDIDTLTAGRIGRDVLLIARARYDRPRVEYFINEKKIPSETYMGRLLYHPDPSAAISFIDDGPDSLVLGGSDRVVKAAIENMGTAPPSTLLQNTKLMDSIRTVESGNQIWAAGEFSADMLPKEVRGPMASAALLQAFTGGIYQMRVDQDVHIKATGNFKDAQSAQTAGDLLRGFLAVAKLQVAQQQDFMNLLDAIHVDYSGDKMTIGFEGSGELLNKLKDRKPTLERAE